MKPSYTLLVMFCVLGAAVQAQVVPATTGPAGLPVSGTLNYSIRYSQTAQVSGGQDGQEWSAVSGDSSYTNTSKRLPFTMQYGGGYGWVWAGPPSAGNVFQHLALTQGFVGRKWSLAASDNVGYTFETPTTGFSGVPGSGEPIGISSPTTLPDQSILAVNTRSVDNDTTATFGRILGPAMSLNIGGSAEQLRFIDSDGEDMDTLTGSAGLTRRLGARASLFGQYTISRYNYSGIGYVSAAGAPPLKYTQTSSVQLGYTRQWNRQITTSVAAGPQWISSSSSTVVPSSTNVFVSASISDKLRFGTASLSYSHGVSGGSGFMPGTESDDASANFSRDFGRNRKLTVGLTGSYMRTSSLSSYYFYYLNSSSQLQVANLGITEDTNSKYGEVQATRQLGRYFNVFANYTLIDQSSNLHEQFLQVSSNANILNGRHWLLSAESASAEVEVRFGK
jgi:hypothetical protein